MTRWTFDGTITGVGSSSGVRVVLGRWSRSPFGGFADAMVETNAGHRVLLAPTPRVADFVAATYSFDEVRVEALECVVTPTWLTAGSASLQLAVGIGRRTPLGWLLRTVPTPVATAPAWCAVTDPVARVLLPGVRTRGRTGTGAQARREFYGATDHHRLVSLVGSFDASPLGELARVDPPPGFGFSSSPPTPSITTVTTTVEAADL